VNASPSTLLRALRGLGSVALLLTLFEACSGSEANPPKPPAGPATIKIKEIALGHGFYNALDPTSYELACDYTIGVNVGTTNWTLYPPGKCAGALQCGQLRVTLFDSDGNILTQVVAAGNGVSLDVSSLPTPPSVASYKVTAELIEDSGHPYVETDGGVGSDSTDIHMTLPEKCPPDTGTGGAPASGTGGSGGDHASAGNSASGGESAGTGGIAGATGGTAGTAGAGEIAGTAGIGETAGTGGSDATGGSAGTAGTAGIAGIAGIAEIAGNSGTGGTQ